jgi:hypothetical protein
MEYPTLMKHQVAMKQVLIGGLCRTSGLLIELWNAPSHVQQWYMLGWNRCGV